MSTRCTEGVEIRCTHQLRVEPCGNVAERTKAADKAWGGSPASGKYRMKQSTKYADLSVGPYTTAPRGVAMAIRFMSATSPGRSLLAKSPSLPVRPARSLRRQFQRFTGQSPIAFHRNLRLEAARHALCDNHAKTDITTAASMHGFSHLSHFTGQYRRRYGELPSATLRAVRESPLPLPLHAISDPISLVVLPFTCAGHGI